MTNVERKKGTKLPCGRPVPDWFESQYSSKENRFEALKKKLESYVTANKLNQSDSRIKILEVVAQYESHFTVSQLIAKVSKAYPKIGSATVYRSIQVFTLANILRETLSTDSGEKIYEVEGSKHHDHIVCLDCDAILEFHESEIEVIQEKLLSKMGFREARHRHVIYVHCEYLKN